jgi:hypothetical protein
VYNTGAGVAFFNTFDASHAYKRINIQSGTIVNLSADPGGALPGILFFQDRAYTGSEGLLDGKANLFQSGSTSTLSGSLYFPTQDVRFQSGSTFTISNGSVVARRMLAESGTNVVFSGYGGAGGGTGYFGLSRASIVE